MNKKLLVLLILLGLGALLFASLETYKTEWSVNHSVSAVKSTPVDGNYSIDWGNLLITPLHTGASSQKIIENVTTTMITGFESVSLHAKLAPGEMTEVDQNPGSVALFLSVQKWDIKRTFTGWTAQATARLDSLRLIDRPEELNLQVNISVNADGRYKGWLKRSTVEKQLAKKISDVMVNGIADELRKNGAHLPESTNQTSRDGLFFDFFRSFGRRASYKEPGPVQGVNHPLLLPEAEVDYYWDLPQKTVLAYRVATTGTALEAALEVPVETSRPFERFMNSTNQSRKVFNPVEITHWDPKFTGEQVSSRNAYDSRQEEVFERYVLVIAPRE